MRGDKKLGGNPMYTWGECEKLYTDCMPRSQIKPGTLVATCCTNILSRIFQINANKLSSLIFFLLLLLLLWLFICSVLPSPRKKKKSFPQKQERWLFLISTTLVVKLVLLYKLDRSCWLLAWNYYLYTEMSWLMLWTLTKSWHQCVNSLLKCE